MDYDHGIRVTPLIHELSPLEKAIHNYSNKAKTYHKKKSLLAVVIGETEKERIDRESQLKKELMHLDTERRLTEAIIDVQAQLEEYKRQNNPQTGETKNATLSRIKRMQNEKHHPTDTLAKYMRAEGRPKPSPKHTPHHIIPGKGRTKAIYRARIRLHTLGIGINDPHNGVWLIRLKKDKGHWSMPESSSHLEMHTKNYEGWVERHINLARTTHSAYNKLNYLCLLLESGTQPKNITMPPDNNWKGL